MPGALVCVLDVTSFNPYKALRGVIPFSLMETKAQRAEERSVGY